MDRKIKILVADDDQLILSVVEFKLLELGYEVITAIDGREAIKKIDDENPDLVITDILMPHVSGLRVATYLKEKYPDKKNAVIILTAIRLNAQVFKDHKIEIASVFIKPIEFNVLTERIKEIFS